MSNKIYRQGDILFIETDSVPESGTPAARVGGRIIVAEGESTGHHHAIAAPQTQMFTQDALTWIVAPDVTEVTHEEHDTVTLPAGRYWVVRQRTWQRGTVRRVLD